MSTRNTFEKAMRGFRLSPSSPVYLAISGGVDSVVLAHLLREAGYNAIWLHMNFQLRGAESERDQQFVEALATEWGQTLHTQRVDAGAYAEQNKLSIQEAARTLRYEWFAQVVKSAGPTAVLLTAHHADDNIETLLMNFLRGTGIKGLTGIPPINDHIRRPLLGISRNEIEAYAAQHSIEFVTDSSNLRTDYTRNQLRLEWMPLLRNIYPQVDSNLLRNIERFRSVYSIYQEAVQRWLRKYVQVKKEEQWVSAALLLKPANRAMLHEWLAAYGFTEGQEGELIRLGDSESGHFIVSADGEYRVIKHRKHFILSPVKENKSAEQWIEAGTTHISFAEGNLLISKSDQISIQKITSANKIMLDAGELQFPLLMRRWREGDYFYPFGLNKKKKVARFLIDQKLSTIEKEKVWVLESGSRIVWVVGYRMDHRFRITEQTREAVLIELVRDVDA